MSRTLQVGRVWTVGGRSEGRRTFSAWRLGLREAGEAGRWVSMGSSHRNPEGRDDR